MAGLHDLNGWLPIGIIFTSGGVSVKWIEFGEKRIMEPFFPQTVRQLRMAEPPARERVTSAEALVTYAHGLPSAPPAVVIFHVSRCGSTLLGNALGTGQRVMVLSEARPVSALVNLPTSRTRRPSKGVEQMRRALLDAVIRTCAYHHHDRDVRPVIKCNASSLLWMSEMRHVWPNTPFVILVRNPVEVMVSNILRPAGWMRARHVSLDGTSLFGWSGHQVQEMSDEEYCARGLGQFLKAASRQRDLGCTVIDYDDLTPSRVAGLARQLEIDLPSVESPDYLRVFGTYSKDVNRTSAYCDDRGQKAQQASEAIRSAAAEWAEEPYRALLGRSSVLQSEPPRVVH